MISRKKSLTPEKEVEDHDSHMTPNGAKHAGKGNVAKVCVEVPV